MSKLFELFKKSENADLGEKLNNDNEATVTKKESAFSIGVRKMNSLFWIAIAILAILIVISAILLSIRLYNFSKIDDREVSLKANSVAELDVFSLEYRNEEGDITIKGADGEKVLAPGSKVDYTIRVRNTDKIAIDYVFEPTISELSKYELPVVVRMIGPDEEYLIGDAKTWVPVSDVNKIEDSRTLLKNESVEYIFQWKWEFESGNDEYDTWLGSNTAKKDLGLKMTCSIDAQANTSAEFNGGIFGSPDTRVIVYAIILITLLVTAITLLILSLIKKPEVEVVPMPEPIIEPVYEPIPLPELRFKEFCGKMSIVNLDVLQNVFEDGALISLAVLKEKGLISPKARQMKVLARNGFFLTKSFTIETQAISAVAKATVLESGGEVRITKP